MKVVLDNVANFSHEPTLLSDIQNWLIKKIVGKKAVCINMTLFLGECDEVGVVAKHGVYIENCAFPLNQNFVGR